MALCLRVRALEEKQTREYNEDGTWLGGAWGVT